MEIKEKEKETEEPPKVFTKKTVIKWSNTFKKLRILEAEGQWKTCGIRDKAKRFLKNDCIEYYKDPFDSSKNCYICKPIPDYNSTTYHMKPSMGGFTCDCQFYQTTAKTVPNLICSHIAALKLMLKIWNSERRADKEEFG